MAPGRWYRYGNCSYNVGPWRPRGGWQDKRRPAPLLDPNAPAAWLNTDAVRKEIANVAWADTLPVQYYTPEARTRIYQEIETRAKTAAQGGQSVIFDASFSRIPDRNSAESLARRLMYRFLGILLTAELEVRCARANRRLDNPSDADEAYIRNAERLDLPSTSEAAWSCLGSEGTLDETLTRVISHIYSVIGSAKQPLNIAEL